MADMMSQIEQMSLISAILSDEECKKRLSAILAAQAALDAEREEYRKEQDAAAGRVTEMTAALGQKEGDLAKRSADLDRREAAMREVLDGLNAEKAAFEQVRKQVAAEHQARAADLDNREESASKTAARLAEMMKKTTDDEHENAKVHAKLWPVVAKLRAAIAELDDVA